VARNISIPNQCKIVFEVFSFLAICDQGRNKGWTIWVAAGGANFRGSKTSLEYSNASLNDRDTFLEMSRYRFRRYANVIECIYTHLCCIASYTPRLYGTVYCC
jgi:hypothetical protein